MANQFVARNGLISLGSVTVPYTAVTTAYTVGVNDYVVDVISSNPINITLPTAVGVEGKTYVIKNSGNATITVVTTSSQTIDGALTRTLLTKASVTLVSTNSNWVVASLSKSCSN